MSKSKTNKNKARMLEKQKIEHKQAMRAVKILSLNPYLKALIMDPDVDIEKIIIEARPHPDNLDMFGNIKRPQE